MNIGWERPPEYDDPPEPPEEDCLNCGMCESCIERSISFAQEMNDREEVPNMPDANGSLRFAGKPLVPELRDDGECRRLHDESPQVDS